MEFALATDNMIKQQLRTNRILDTQVLSLYETLPRHAFVPEQYRDMAYSDLQIPLPHNERMMTPLEEATILERLQLRGHETVLEIGTGSGFLTALLSKLCKKVVSIDIYPDFTQKAQQILQEYHCDNVSCITGDGHKGDIEHAPYDVIVYTGALKTISETQKLQVTPGGCLVAIFGNAPVLQAQLHRLDHYEQWSHEYLFETCLPYLIHADEKNHFVF
ncbi:MAG: protein-L-isoaspartate O-methyltransferase [Legionellaceae bacterium]|nr:protein-L-isoaspartate O-methyltransferase [Legionellaceae bacterium]